MFKKIQVILMVVVSSMVLAACSNSGKKDDTSSKNGTVLTGQGTDEYYQGVIHGGHYQTSKSRGVDLQQNDNEFNLKGFEQGLLDISKEVFSTNKYIFQEGQYLSTATTEKWLGRVSGKNPEGLNPDQPKNKTVPLYLQQIDEQDYMNQDGNNNLKIKGMTIGLGLNSVYSYTKKDFGPTYKQNISDATLKSQGQDMANKVLSRLRKNKDLRNIPIVIALYKQAPSDSLVGGEFVEYSVNEPGTTTVNNWKPVEQKSYVFPVSDASKSPNKNDVAAFNEFKNKVQNFFPNISAITAQAQYTSGKLSGMHISITTQFYSYTEIINFTQYLQGAAQKYLPSGMPIDITVSSSEGMQSYLYRGSNDKSFKFHVFSSY